MTTVHDSGARGRIGMRGTTFRDADDRHVILRGVNFGGDAKVPVTPNGHTCLPTDFADHRTVSFVGRPAALDELDGHLARLKHWGFNCLRPLTTWEAIEHAVPGMHDEAYLDYYAEVCRRAGAHGLYVFVDFHQDAWARMSGGDGAPGWTFEVAGLDFRTFGANDAAHVMQYAYDYRLGGRQAGYPVRNWSGNYARPANGIMSILFFAGADLAPSMKVDGVGIQQFLQAHYFGCMGAVAARVAHLDNVLGFDTPNEPGNGYVGKAMTAPIARYRGPVWTILDGLALASGLPRSLPVIAPGQGVVGRELFNEDEVSIWLPGHENPFRTADAWDIDRDGAVVAREDYFQTIDGRSIDLATDYMAPFFNRVADTVRGVRPDWLVFAETDPFDAILHGLPAGDRGEAVWGDHVTTLDLMYNAIDRLLISSTQWNYTVSNRNDPMIGDGWNQEDLSIWSADQATTPDDPDSGGRAIDGFCRPYVRAAQGTILRQRFDRQTGKFEADIHINSTIDAPTEIYVPKRVYPGGVQCDAAGTDWSQDGQLLIVRSAAPDPFQLHILRR